MLSPGLLPDIIQEFVVACWSEITPAGDILLRDLNTSSIYTHYTDGKKNQCTHLYPIQSQIPIDQSRNANFLLLMIHAGSLGLWGFIPTRVDWPESCLYQSADARDLSNRRCNE